MYIRSKPFTGHESKVRVQIIESIRTGDKVSQKIVRHVGVAHNKEEEAKMRAYAAELMLKIEQEKDAKSNQLPLFERSQKLGRPAKKDLSQILPVDEVYLKDLFEIKRVVEGVSDIGGAAYEQFRFDQILPRKRDREILRDIVLSRMVNPDSKRGQQKIMASKFDKYHDLDAIYRMMDKLYEEIPTIKELVFNSTLSLIPGREVGLVFFDVTTLYFESVEVDELRAFGYSKDHRFNTTQVVLALATNEDGLPIGYELFSGATAEVSTLIKAIDSWQKFLKVKDLCFIADRAMFSKANLELLDNSGYRYVVAAKLKSLSKQMQEEILDGNNYSPTVIGEEFAWIGEFEHDGKRLITSYKSKRASNDVKERNNILKKIEKTIGNKGATKRLISNSGVKKYTSSDGGTSYIDDRKIAIDAMWDGIHGVITNDHDICAAGAIAKYARLWKIEEAFRISKHNLQMRPIYHWTEKRIHAHIAICYMSFAVLKRIEYQVCLTQKISPKAIMELLLSVESSIYKHKVTQDLYRVPGVTALDARKIYRAFNIRRTQDASIYLK